MSQSKKPIGAEVAMEGIDRGRGAMTNDKPRLYLAGPMSGYPESNYPLFNAEANRLRALGYHVENPAESPEQSCWADYMRHAIARLMTCDEVAVLPGWNESSGACLEFTIAHRLGIPCRTASNVTAPIEESAA